MNGNCLLAEAGNMLKHHVACLRGTCVSAHGQAQHCQRFCVHYTEAEF